MSGYSRILNTEGVGKYSAQGIALGIEIFNLWTQTLKVFARGTLSGFDGFPIRHRFPGRCPGKKLANAYSVKERVHELKGKM